MQQYVDDAMPASDHVCYMLLLLLFRKEKTNPNNLYQPDLSTHAIKEKATATSMKKTCWLILQDGKIFL